MKDLMSKAEPKTALSALESMKVWQGGIESRQNQAANKFIELNLPNLEAQILDGVPFDQVAAELLENGANGSDYKERIATAKRCKRSFCSSLASLRIMAWRKAAARHA